MFTPVARSMNEPSGWPSALSMPASAIGWRFPLRASAIAEAEPAEFVDERHQVLTVDSTLDA